MACIYGTCRTKQSSVTTSPKSKSKEKRVWEGVVTKEEASTLDRSSSKGGSGNTEVPEYQVDVCVCVCGVCGVWGVWGGGGGACEYRMYMCGGVVCVYVCIYIHAGDI